MNETGGNARFRSLRILALTLVTAPVLIGVALYFVLGTVDGGMDNPPLWIPLGQIVFAVAALALSEKLGYRTPAALHGEPEEVGNASVMAFQTAMILRFVLCESLTIVSIALAFVVEPQTFLIYVVGGALSVALMLFEVLPSHRVIARTEASLEREGRPSYLRDSFGVA